MNLEEKLKKISELFLPTHDVMEFLREKPNITEALLSGYEEAKKQFGEKVSSFSLELGYFRGDKPIPHLYMTLGMSGNYEDTKKIRDEFDKWWLDKSTAEIRVGMTPCYGSADMSK